MTFFSIAQNKNWQLLQEVTGDLDKDNIPEKVVVYTTTDLDKDELGLVRELQILKKTGEKWRIWKTSRNVVLPSEGGGMMGDPFQEIEIRNGILLITNAGGSSWKWGYTDKFRYQNGYFELIGHSSEYGKLCEYMVNLDYNLATGQVDIKKEYETCENDDQKITKKENEKFTYRLKYRVTMDNRKVKIVFRSPKFKHEIQL